MLFCLWDQFFCPSSPITAKWWEALLWDHIIHWWGSWVIKYAHCKCNFFYQNNENRPWKIQICQNHDFMCSNAFLLKVTNVNNLALGTNFRLYCPKERNHHKIMMFKNGTTKDDLRYKNLCKEEQHIRIAYNNDWESFWVFLNLLNNPKLGGSQK